MKWLHSVSHRRICAPFAFGLVTKPLFSHRVPGTSTEFVLCWVPFPVEGKREAVAGGEHHTRSVKCINLPLRALIMIQVNCCAKGKSQGRFGCCLALG